MSAQCAWGIRLSTSHKIIALAVVLVALWGIHEYDKAVAVAEAKAELTVRMEEYAEKTERATKALEASHRSALKDKNAKIDSIERQLADTIVRLRDRPVRPDVVTITEIRESCTGAQLYREDAEFLAREAARAERVLEERNYYWQQYEQARLKLETLNAED